jgi:hypothetical protein
MTPILIVTRDKRWSLELESDCTPRQAVMRLKKIMPQLEALGATVAVRDVMIVIGVP